MVELDTPGPPGPPGTPQQKPNSLEALRNFCANKKYVIHKIVDDRVYFWYYENRKWTYYNKPFSDFSKNENGEVEECGDDTVVIPDDMSELKESYNKMDNDDFNQVKKEYMDSNINKEWTSTLLTALQIQKNTPVPQKYKNIFEFVPVLIESVIGNKVNYYYLTNNSGDVTFKEGNISIDKFEQDLLEIVDDLKLSISMEREEGSRRQNEWIEHIKTAITSIDTADIKRIKAIYSEFPLSKSSQFFMKDLINDNGFGKSDYNNLNSVDLSNYVLNKFGPNTAKSFYAKMETNKFGTKTINFVEK
jgi:hypothetical protein